MGDEERVIHIRELDIDTIAPSTANAYDPAAGGSKIVVIGKPGTGKTTVVSSILHAKKHIIPVGIVVSGTEDSNGHYSRMFPSSFVYNKYDERVLEGFVRRQKLAKQHLSNSWAVVVLDDCTDDPRVFNQPFQHAMYKNGRHWKMLYILSLQYGMDVKPVIRTNVDGVFILREPNMRNRRILWENYASCIPDFDDFCSIMDQLTEDYHCMYINNQVQSNEVTDCVFYYKAPLVPEFKFGCDEMWMFHEERKNPNYRDPV